MSEQSRDPIEAVMAAAFGPVVDVQRAAGAAGVTEGPGTIIGPYKLMEQIGEGGMGLVFVAEQVQPVRRKVAVKVLKPGMDSRAVVARFEAERQALALMDHPHIARVLDGGQTPAGRPYFVMELVRGEPITDYCARHGLTPRERLKLFVDVCHAVQHAHHKGIIHRDLKPSNILVSAHDGTPEVKVIDFGVAKATGQQLTDKTVYTHFTQLMGTPLYMSPEQAGQSRLDVDTRTDIYALGVVLYELLTGTTPFDQTRFAAAEYDEIRRIIREEDPPRPSTRLRRDGGAGTRDETRKAGKTVAGAGSSLVPHVASLRELDWIVMKCLEKDRNRRYETADALAMDVLRFLNDEPVLACPPSAWYRFRKFARRHKTALISATAVSVLTVLAFVLLVASNIVIGRQQQETQNALAAETQAKADLEDALKRERRSLYFQRIARADLEWWACNVGRADQLLGECPAEYRHWEWHYLKRLCHAELRALHGHTQAIRGVAFSPEGRRLASASDDRTVKVWTLDASEPPITLAGHQELVAAVAFSPDGRRLASASGDWVTGKPGEVKIWDLVSGRELLNLTGHRAAVAGAAFSPDGRLVATAGWDWTLRLWDAATGKEIRRLNHQSSLKCLAFSPDGSQIATGAYDRVITLWNVADGRNLATLRGHTGSVLSVAFSPDGKQLASAGWDHTVRIWDLPQARARLVLRGHKEVVHGVAFSPDGRTVASAASDGTVRLWQCASGEEQFALRHGGIVFGVGFSPGGRCLASSSSDHTVKLWDVTANPHHRSFAWPDATRPRLAISPDGRLLSAANRRPLTRGGTVHLRVLETQTGRQVRALPEYPGGFNSVAFSPDGKRLASDWGADARTWDVQTGRAIQTFTAHAGPVTAVAFAHDGRRLATGSEDHAVKLWDADSGRELVTLTGHAAAVTAIAFSRRTPYLASASKDHTVRVWKRGGEPPGALAFTFFGHQRPVTDVAFSPDGQLIASSSEDGTVRLWRPQPGSDAAVHALVGNGSAANSVCFSADSQRLASAHEDGSVILWDTASGLEALSLRRQLLRAERAVVGMRVQSGTVHHIGQRHLNVRQRRARRPLDIDAVGRRAVYLNVDAGGVGNRATQVGIGRPTAGVHGREVQAAADKPCHADRDAAGDHHAGIALQGCPGNAAIAGHADRDRGRIVQAAVPGIGVQSVCRIGGQGDGDRVGDGEITVVRPEQGAVGHRAADGRLDRSINGQRGRFEIDTVAGRVRRRHGHRGHGRGAIGVHVYGAAADGVVCGDLHRRRDVRVARASVDVQTGGHRRAELHADAGGHVNVAVDAVQVHAVVRDRAVDHDGRGAADREVAGGVGMDAVGGRSHDVQADIREAQRPGPGGAVAHVDAVAGDIAPHADVSPREGRGPAGRHGQGVAADVPVDGHGDVRHVGDAAAGDVHAVGASVAGDRDRIGPV